VLLLEGKSYPKELDGRGCTAKAESSAAADLPAQSHDVGEKFSRIAAGLGAAVEELQELSRGIHPAILSEAGLGPALEALALRSPIPVALEVMTDERFLEPVEVCAYFVASESLANAANHSRSTRIDVALTVKNEKLLLSVCDDGIGGPITAPGPRHVHLDDRGGTGVLGRAGDRRPADPRDGRVRRRADRA
jgi:signal transduction histidine kinase